MIVMIAYTVSIIAVLSIIDEIAWKLYTNGKANIKRYKSRKWKFERKAPLKNNGAF